LFADRDARDTSVAAAISSAAIPSDLKMVVSFARAVEPCQPALRAIRGKSSLQKKSRRLILSLRLEYWARFSSHPHHGKLLP
jgi:hypothetical protein